MNKRVVVKLGIMILIAVACRVFVAAKNNGDDKFLDEEKQMYELGKAQAELGAVCLDDNSIISQEDIDNKSEILSNIFGGDEREINQNISNKAIEEQAIYLKALDAGINISDEEYDAYICELKECIYSSDEYDMFKAYISGYNISEEEYWNIAENTYRRNLIISKYIDEYCVENVLNAIDDTVGEGVEYIDGKYYISTDSQQDVEKEIQEYIQNEINLSIEEFDIKVQ